MKTCAVLVITTMALATHALEHMNRTSFSQVHELPQNYCSDNREGTLFS